MEIIELYCELLLARAAVLDQIAFAEKGARARSKARETVKAESGATESRGLGLGFARPFGRSTDQKKRDEPAKSKQTESAAGEQEEEDESCYIDPGLDEAAAAIFYAWPRFPREVRELTTLRSLLIDRWGRDFAALAQDNKAAVNVPERLVKRLRVRPPAPELVESYLREIAKAYGVAWPKEKVATAETFDKPPDYPDEGDVAEQRQQRESPSTAQQSHLADLPRASEADELSRATPPRDIGPHDVSGRSPVSVAPPGPSSENPNPRVKIPGEQQNTPAAAAAAAAAQPASPPRKDSKGIPDVDELARRFAALKR